MSLQADYRKQAKGESALEEPPSKSTVASVCLHCGQKIAKKPQCVTLSSDEEDDSFQESKKRKSDDPVAQPGHTILTESAQELVQPNLLEADFSTETNSPVKANEEERSKDLLRWKESGLSGPFSAVSCRSVLIGSYKYVPTFRVLFSTEGIVLEAPMFNNSEETKYQKWIKLTILTEQVLQADVNFHLPAIFLYVTPAVTRRFSSKLGLNRTGPYWDSASIEESQKRLTLLPYYLDDSAKSAIKHAFEPKGVYQEINYDEANRLLVLSSPRTVLH